MLLHPNPPPELVVTADNEVLLDHAELTLVSVSWLSEVIDPADVNPADTLYADTAVPLRITFTCTMTM